MFCGAFIAECLNFEFDSMFRTIRTSRSFLLLSEIGTKVVFAQRVTCEFLDCGATT